eukprot:m.67484 g.67484  ORF g.67484 m.67484 type:complete len:310 (+) comp9868_c2_seq1:3309-4238(+)
MSDIAWASPSSDSWTGLLAPSDNPTPSGSNATTVYPAVSSFPITLRKEYDEVERSGTRSTVSVASFTTRWFTYSRFLSPDSPLARGAGTYCPVSSHRNTGSGIALKTASSPDGAVSTHTYTDTAIKAPIKRYNPSCADCALASGRPWLDAFPARAGDGSRLRVDAEELSGGADSTMARSHRARQNWGVLPPGSVLCARLRGKESSVRLGLIWKGAVRDFNPLAQGFSDSELLLLGLLGQSSLRVSLGCQLTAAADSKLFKDGRGGGSGGGGHRSQAFSRGKTGSWTSRRAACTTTTRRCRRGCCRGHHR